MKKMKLDMDKMRTKLLKRVGPQHIKPAFSSVEEYRAWQNDQAEVDSKRIANETKTNYMAAMMRESDVALAAHTFSNFHADEEWQARLVEQAGNYIEGLKVIDKSSSLNLLICGEYGSGKTHLACAIVNHFTNEIGGVGLAKQFNVLIRDLWKHKEDPKLAEATRNRALKADILFIDEVGAAERELFDGQIGELGEIIRTRVNNNRPTIITSNWEAKEFQKHIDSFVFGGLRQGGLTVFEIPKNQKRDQRSKVVYSKF